MCEFISWKRTPSGTILFLTDKEAFSPFGREILKGTQNNDVLGHGAITVYYGKEATRGAVSFEEEEFWDRSKYPSEIAQHLESPGTLLATWGGMLKKALEPEKAYQILKGAPEPWREGLSNLLIQIVSKDIPYSYHALLTIKSLAQEERVILIEAVSKDAFCSCHTLLNIRSLTQEERAILIEAVSKSANQSFRTLLNIRSLTQEERAILIEAVSKSANCSYCTLRDIGTLTQEERATLIQGISKDTFQSYSALLYIRSLTQEERAILEKARSK